MAQKTTQEKYNESYQQTRGINPRTGRRYIDEKRSTQGPKCFPKGTGVLTPFGMRDISEIYPGDEVIAINPNTLEKQTRRVLSALTHSPTEIWVISLEDERVIRTTPGHSFRVGPKWRPASRLRVGDMLEVVESEGRTSCLTITATSQTLDTEPVYNLVVEEDFTYVANGAIVHCFTHLRAIRVCLYKVRSFIQGLNRNFPRYVPGGLTG